MNTFAGDINGELLFHISCILPGVSHLSRAPADKHTQHWCRDRLRIGGDWQHPLPIYLTHQIHLDTNAPGYGFLFS